MKNCKSNTTKSLRLKTTKQVNKPKFKSKFRKRDKSLAHVHIFQHWIEIHQDHNDAFTSIRYLISSNRKWQQDDLTSNTSKCKIARLITVLTS